MIMLLLAALLGGLFWRIRGGWLGEYNPGGTQVARLLGTLPLVILGFITGGLYPALLAMTHIPMLMLMGWWDSFSLNVDLRKSMILVLRGLLQTTPIALGLLVLGYPLYYLALLGGASFGVLHYLCTKYAQNIPHVIVFKSKLIDGPLSLVEITYGIVLYVSFIFILI